MINVVAAAVVAVATAADDVPAAVATAADDVVTPSLDMVI